MILIGQYDSPFVRRVGIALTLYGLPFEHRPWSTFGDAEKIRPLNPLVRVPTFVLDDGLVLGESRAILDRLDGLVPAEHRMFPAAEPERHRQMRIAELGMGAAEKGVSLFYERRMHEQISQAWADRCRSQVEGALAALDADRAARSGEYWFGERIGHADIAVACAWRFLQEALPDLIPHGGFPALRAHAERMEALPVFRTIQQVFVPPA